MEKAKPRGKPGDNNNSRGGGRGGGAAGGRDFGSNNDAQTLFVKNLADGVDVKDLQGVFPDSKVGRWNLLAYFALWFRKNEMFYVIVPDVLFISSSMVTRNCFLSLSVVGNSHASQTRRFAQRIRFC